MAKRAQPAVVSDPEDDADDDQEPDRGDLWDLVQDPGNADTTWTIYRLFAPDQKIPAGINASKGALAMRFTGPFTYDDVKRQLGGGFYRIYGRRSGERNCHTITGLAIEGVSRLADDGTGPTPGSGSYVGVGPLPPTPPNINRFDANSLGHNGENLAVELRSEIRALRDSLTAAKPQDANLDMLVKLLALVRPPQSTVAELMQAMDAGRQSAGGGGMGSLSELLEVLDSLEQRAARAAGGGESWASVIREVVPQALEAFQGMRRQRAAPAAVPITRAAPPAPSAPPPAPAPAAAAQRDEEVPDLVKLLVRAMQLNRDPSEVAESSETFLDGALLAQMRAASDELVLAQLKPWIVEARADGTELARYDDLPWPRVQRFVIDYLAALRADDPETDGAGAAT